MANQKALLRNHEEKIVERGPAPAPRPIDPGQLVGRPPTIPQPPWWAHLTKENGAEATVAGSHVAHTAAEIQMDIWERSLGTNYSEDKRTPTTSSTEVPVKPSSSNFPSKRTQDWNMR